MTRFQVGSNGLFAYQKNELFEGLIKVDKDPMGPEIKETISFRAPKIPRAVFDRACAYIRWCKEEHQSEGMVAFVWRNGGWDLACPHQWNSAAGICSHPELTGEEFLSWRGDIHGHPGESSCHSGIDHADEKRKRDGVFLVVGVPFDLNHATAAIMFCDRHFEVPTEFVVDVNGPPGDGTFPDEWKFRFHKAPCEICKKDVHALDIPGALPYSQIQEWRRLQASPITGNRQEMIDLAEMAAHLFGTDQQYGGLDTEIFECQCGQKSDHVLCPSCKEPMAAEDVFRAVGEVMGDVMDFYSIIDPAEEDPGERRL